MPTISGSLDKLAPSLRLIRSRRLRGGLFCRTHVLTLEAPSGGRSKIVLRRYRPEWPGSTPETAVHEFRVLKLLADAGIAAPLPLWLDAEGSVFGVPAMALSYIPGRSFIQGQQSEPLVNGMAAALRSVHAIDSHRFDLAWLHGGLRQDMRTRLEHRRRHERFAAEPLAQAVYDAIAEELESIELDSSTLIHADFWAGNTVWYRGGLIAVVDWTEAKLGDPRIDVASCRMDLVFTHGVEVADSFQRAYEREIGSNLQNMRFFDLYMGLQALLFLPFFVTGYHDAGWSELTLEDCGQRTRDFLRVRLAD